MSRSSFATRCSAVHRQGDGPIPTPTESQVWVSYDGTAYLYDDIEDTEIRSFITWAVGVWCDEHDADAANIEESAYFDHLARTLWLD